jgi:hypothetical protein
MKRAVSFEPLPAATSFPYTPSEDAVLIPNARLGGLHHRYSWREAA